jgi:membrane protein implicated in regulation of membrane protease activity
MSSRGAVRKYAIQAAGTVDMSLNTFFLVAAVIGGTVMVCQFALTLLGMDNDLSGDGGHHGGGGGHGHDVGHVVVDHPGDLAAINDADAHHSDSSWLFGVVSFRTLIGALTFFGLAGKTATSAGLSDAWALLIAVAAGVGAMFGMYWLLRAISGLESSGNQRISAALGRRATVYIPVPADSQGAGKVQMSMQNRIVEFQAVTDEPERLKTGETVEVVAIAGSDVVRVRRIVQAVEV